MKARKGLSSRQCSIADIEKTVLKSKLSRVWIFIALFEKKKKSRDFTTCSGP